MCQIIQLKAVVSPHGMAAFFAINALYNRSAFCAHPEKDASIVMVQEEHIPERRHLPGQSQVPALAGGSMQDQIG